MSRGRRGPFSLARSLEVFTPADISTGGMLRHIGSAASVSFRDRWSELQENIPELRGKQHPGLSTRCVTLIFKDEIQAASLNEDTNTPDPKLLKRLHSAMNQQVVRLNGMAAELYVQDPENPDTLPLDMLQVSPAMLDGTHIEEVDKNTTRLVVRLAGSGNERLLADDEPFRSLPAERRYLQGVVHEETGYGPRPDRSVGIGIAELTPMQANIAVSPGQTVAQWLCYHVSADLVQARSAGLLIPAATGPLEMLHD